MSYTKTITPQYVRRPVGKHGTRSKLTGYLGELHDGEMLLHSMEYGTYHEAEVILDQLMFELMSSYAPYHGPDPRTEAPAPVVEPASTCCFCHKPHSPQSCDEMRALLFAPDTTSKAAHPLDFDEAALDAYYVKRDQVMDLIYPPLDVEFAAFGPEV